MLKRIRVFFTSLSMLLALPLAAEPLPDLGDSSRTVFSASMETKLGRTYMQYLRQSGNVIEDPIDREYINTLGQKLVAASHHAQSHFYFFFMASDSINSFAGPDGYIAVNSALMLATENESELAAVLAHEIAHVTQGHIARKIADASKSKYSTVAGMLAAIALGTVSGAAGQAAFASTIAGQQQSMLNFSRDMESEADRVGITTLANANFNPHSMPGFFIALAQNNRYYTKMPELLSNHPLTPSRIADAENRAALYPKTSLNSSSRYYLIKERMRVMTTEDLDQLLHYYQTLLKTAHANQDALEYGYALALDNANQYQKAYDLLMQLSEKNPQEILYPLAAASVASDQKQYAKAEEILEKLYQLYPGNYAVAVYYAAALLAMNQASQALGILQHHRLNNPDDPIPYGLLSQIQAKAGRLADAYQTRARYLTEYGQYAAALNQLQVAQALPHLDADTKARLQAQMQEIQRVKLENK